MALPAAKRSIFSVFSEGLPDLAAPKNSSPNHDCGNKDFDRVVQAGQNRLVTL
jgi:hypothetical protein